jgi:hypothetical protein
VGFVVTDFEMISRVRPGGKNLGGWSLQDPPGGFSALSFLASDSASIYSFAVVGTPQFGPVAATVPIAFTGFDGVPDLFAAQVDNSGLPVVVTGPGTCFIPTSIRINDSSTGAILPAFVPTVPTFVSETVDSVPEPSTTMLVIIGLCCAFVGWLRKQASWGP